MQELINTFKLVGVSVTHGEWASLLLLFYDPVVSNKKMKISCDHIPIYIQYILTTAATDEGSSTSPEINTWWLLYFGNGF